MKFCIFILLLLINTSLKADVLPDVLSLEKALDFANDPRYFKILNAQSAIEYKQSEIENAESELGFRAQLEIESALLQPSETAVDQSTNESRVSLRLVKPLYDFGGSNERISAANIEHAALEANIQFIIGRRKIEIAHQFLEVILSDLKNAWDSEVVAVTFYKYYKNKSRREMELISDVEYLESESKYLDSVNKRNISQVNQRYNRAVLAGLINKPFELPENLKKPSFDFSKQVSLEYDELIKNVMDNNPQIILAEKQLDAASKVKTAVSKQFLPRINAEIEVSENSGGFETKDDWRAGISFIVPLYENQNMKSEVSKARANWLKEQAKLFKIQIKVRNQALKLWQEISTLSERRKQLATTQEYRELNLDRSRALHEMEVKTNLGSSMAAISEVQYKQAKNDFSLALSWMQLRHLAGKQNLMKTSL